MIKQSKVKLDKTLFWDIDINDLDFKKNTQFIVSRVLQWGDMEDYQQIKKYYGLSKIKNIAPKVKYLDRKSLNFWSQVFNIPKNKFLCFKTHLNKKQSAFLAR